MRRFPQIAKMLEAGDVNIATVAMISRLLTSSNCDQLLSRIRRRSQDDVRAIVAEYRPESATPDRVRPVCVRVAVDSTRTSSSVRSKPDRETGPSPDGHVPAHTMSQPTPTSGSRSQAAPASADTEAPPPSKIERKHELRFLVGSEFMRKFERVKEILSNRNAGAAMEDVFDAAMESFLHANCPLERARRRARKQAGGEIASSHRRDPAGASARRIKAATRDRVHERDHGRCTWVGPGGRRCGATRNLEIDHIVPVAHGGSNAQSNLRLLCRAHNLLAAEQVYGREFMAPFVARE
jgi:5-methylcytosine-specific restriction endonuclease McrA